MSMRRVLALAPRKENQREAQVVAPPIQFSLSEIKQHFSDSLLSVKNQFDVADSLAAAKNEIGCKIIWRSQIVLAEGLLDFYIHELSKFCLFRMFTGQWEKTDKYASIMVPMSKVEEAIAATESKDWFFRYLNDRFSRDVFLSKESMKDQLNLIGIEFTLVMSKAFPGGKKTNGPKIIEELFKRRNEIAHQNDRSHSTAEQNDITKEFVAEYISHVESIVNSIQAIAEEKEQPSP